MRQGQNLSFKGKDAEERLREVKLLAQAHRGQRSFYTPPNYLPDPSSANEPEKFPGPFLLKWKSRLGVSPTDL